MIPLLVQLLVAAACRSQTTEIVVDTAAHHMVLCDKGEQKAEYKVALGSGGIGKEREGDAKTPLGVYPLHQGRPSSSFHTFILLGYPTKEQRAKGMTGSAVGVHGPARGYEQLGELNVATDWTLGCIAVSSDEQIDFIAAWMKKARCTRIRLE
ncbi:MAG: murein L,D-transpeptidase family protein [Myxococcota bacterium]|nr:L,D-transpeptidase family protein [Myxococcota bacterium]